MERDDKGTSSRHLYRAASTSHCRYRDPIHPHKRGSANILTGGAVQPRSVAEKAAYSENRRG
ncbi:hypothetical protein [Methanocalculus sp.]|uniref:hypothetical protein n=1 Tax=Methanocalculus sp. TaxID=2004547 RepID=UPI002633EEE2|nr:hypothetical protein [Methanocalculus sp.]MDG6249274.1 hypothetical protein [Methanocalculus sp.]